jgi:DNA-binding beta-propeller fold protein YncE
MTLASMLAYLAAIWLPAAGAEVVAEAWRSPCGRPRSLSVNTSDGSCWAATGSSVMHLAADGTVLTQTDGFWSPQSVSSNPVDGTCWVADTGNDQVVHLSADGAEIVRLGGFSQPEALCVNPVDGTCWVADTGNDEVVHLAADGAELLRIGCYEDPLEPTVERCFKAPQSVSVNPTDGSCWVADTKSNEIVHLAADGTQLLRIGSYEDSAVDPPVERLFKAPQSVSVNPTDGSCWVADTGNNYLVHLAADGGALWCGPCFSEPQSISVDPTDGSCWIADTGNGHIVHLDAEGNQILREGLWHLEWEGDLWPAGVFDEPSAVSVDPTDGSCWVADAGDTSSGIVTSDVLRLEERAAGDKLVLHPVDAYDWQWNHYETFARPESVSVNETDNSCWVADTGHSRVVRVEGDGTRETKAWRSGRSKIRSVSVNPTDGSCWFANSGRNEVEHLLDVPDPPYIRSDDFIYPRSVSANPIPTVENAWYGAVNHWFCWVADTYKGEVVRIDEWRDWLGRIQWTRTAVRGFTTPESVSVNREDGSCWVVDSGGSEVVHLAADGTELWRKACLKYPLSLSVNWTDGSCWVADSLNDEVVHLAEDGAGISRVGGFRFPNAVAVDTGDGTCWVADTLNNQVVHLAENGTELWRGGAFHQPKAVAVDPTDGSCWVADTGNDQVVHLVVVEGPPRASFSVFPIGLVGYPVDFTDLSSREPASWLWEFGDGGTSDEQHASHVYLSAGSYDVTLTASNAYGSDSETKTVFILDSFLDVAADHWACDEISACVEAGVVSGYPDGSYQPDAPVDRAQMAVYISRALAGGDEYVPEFTETPTFPDVQKGSWTLDYVEYAVSRNVVAGYEDGLYHPEIVVTRDQMAVYVARALVAPGGEDALADYVPVDPRSFPDVPEEFWAYRHIEYCVEHGVVQGYEDGHYHPEIVVTRDQMAVYVARAFELPM